MSKSLCKCPPRAKTPTWILLRGLYPDLTIYIIRIKDSYWFTLRFVLIADVSALYNNLCPSIQSDLFLLKWLYLSSTFILVCPKQKIFQSVSLWTEVSALFNKFMSLNSIRSVHSQMTVLEFDIHSGLSQTGDISKCHVAKGDTGLQNIRAH